MKNILLLFICTVFVNFAYGQGDSPAILKGLTQTDKSIGATIRTPNGQVTKLTSSSALIETGNNNILENPSFEHSIYDTSWVVSSGSSSKVTTTIDNTKVFHGINSMKITMSAQPLDVINVSPTSNQSYKDGVQGLVSVRVKTSLSGVKVCSRKGFSTDTSNCVSVSSNSKWNLYKVPFIMAEFYNGIAVTSNGTSMTGDVYIDDAFVGPVDLQASVDSSKIAGEAYFAGTTSCNWSRTSTTMGAFTATAACPGPTIAYSSMGSWQTTDSDLPRVTVNNLPAGTYKATFLVNTSINTNAASAIAIYDGSTTCYAVGSVDTTVSSGQIVSCTFTYATAGNRSFEVYAASAANTVSISNASTTPPKGTKFILEHFGSSNIYSSTNSDTDWASCGHNTSSFTGFGTVSAIETQCKRQGSDLLMKGKFTSGTPTAVEARIALPSWNGSQLVSAGTSIIPSIQVSGSVGTNFSSSTYFSNLGLIEPSVSYVTIGNQNSTQASISKANANSILNAGNLLSFNVRIPIEGWNGSNIIVGSFNEVVTSPGTSKPALCSAKISATGVISDQIGGCFSSCTNATTPVCTFTSNYWLSGQVPNCWVIGDNVAALYYSITTSSSYSGFLTNTSGTPVSGARVYFCQGAKQ